MAISLDFVTRSNCEQSFVFEGRTLKIKFLFKKN